MELSAVQSEECYNTKFSDGVEKYLDEIEKDPDFCGDGWFFFTAVKTMAIFSKYVNDKKGEWYLNSIHFDKKYSREEVKSAIMEGLKNLIQDTAVSNGLTFEKCEVTIVVIHKGLFRNTPVEHSLHVPVGEAKISSERATFPLLPC